MLKHFNVSKNEAVLIGDSNYDVEAGTTAGIKVVAVTYGFRSREYLVKADTIIDSFHDLIKIIPQL
jgi:phosphoglycolate phosphatase